MYTHTMDAHTSPDPTPPHARRPDEQELRQLAQELRWDTLSHVSKTGGHLGSSLGVIELTVALHYVFNTPDDRVIWDVSHQVRRCIFAHGRRTGTPLACLLRDALQGPTRPP